MELPPTEKLSLLVEEQGNQPLYRFWIVCQTSSNATEATRGDVYYVLNDKCIKRGHTKGETLSSKGTGEVDTVGCTCSKTSFWQPYEEPHWS